MIIYNYPPKGKSIVVDIYRDAKRRRIYPPLFTDAEGDSCFSIYQIRWIKKCFFNFFFWNFRETTRHFSLRSQNSEYPRIFQVTGANQNARKLLSTDLVNSNNYCPLTCLYMNICHSEKYYKTLPKIGIGQSTIIMICPINFWISKPIFCNFKFLFQLNLSGNIVFLF